MAKAKTKKRGTKKAVKKTAKKSKPKKTVKQKASPKLSVSSPKLAAPKQVSSQSGGLLWVVIAIVVLALLWALLKAL